MGARDDPDNVILKGFEQVCARKIIRVGNGGGRQPTVSLPTVGLGFYLTSVIHTESSTLYKIQAA